MRRVLLGVFVVAWAAATAAGAASLRLLPTKDARILGHRSEVGQNCGRSARLRTVGIKRGSAEFVIMDFDRAALKAFLEKNKGKTITGKLVLVVRQVQGPKTKLEVATIDAGVDFPALLARASAGESFRPPEYEAGIKTRYLVGDIEALAVVMAKGRAILPPGATGRGGYVRRFLAEGGRLEIFRSNDLGPFFFDALAFVRDILVAGLDRSVSGDSRLGIPMRTADPRDLTWQREGNEVSEGPFEDDAMARRLVFVASNGLEFTTLQNSNEQSIEINSPDGLIQLSLMRGNILLTLAPNQVGVKPVTLVLDKNGTGSWDIGHLLSDSEVARARAALGGPQTADVLNSFVNALTEEEILLVADDGTWALNPLFAQSKSCSHAIIWAAIAMEMAILACMIPEPAQPLACIGAILNAIHAIDNANEECA